MAHLYIYASLVLCFLSVTCFVQGDCDTESSQLCNSLCINVNMYTCCNGHIHNGSHLSCCGSSPYNNQTSTCCCDVINEGLSQDVSECCGSEAYNPLNQICCEGHILNKRSAQSLCCGSESFEEQTHLCCGPGLVIHLRKTEHDLCCGNSTYNSQIQCCSISLTAEDLNSSNCSKKKGAVRSVIPGTCINRQKKHKGGRNNMHKHLQDCRSEEDEHHICCSGRRLKKKSGLAKCCGAEVYNLSEENVLCCDGVLWHDQPPGSKCINEGAYSPHNYTVCEKHAYLPAGQQCCGKNTFDPLTEICCNRHRHKKQHNNIEMTCCGSQAYNSNTHKCCSGHLHPNTSLKAECCGPLLLTDLSNQHCCHSAKKSLVYKFQPDHYCCGHLYYNTTLWSCCAEELIPRKQDQMPESKSLRPLTDYNTSTICKDQVVLATLQSEAVKENIRLVVLVNVLYLKNNTIMPNATSLVAKLKDHCSFPALEINRTYLWREVHSKQYEPLSDVSDLASFLHTILTFCTKQ